jgi:hypothetical protein
MNKIDPNKNNSVRVDQNLSKNGSSRQNSRIVEIDSDSDEHHSTTGSSSSAKPIIEEPDDPPLQRSQKPEAIYEPHLHQFYPHSFVPNHAHIQQQLFAMHNPAYYHQHQAFQNGFLYAHHHHPHVHAHIPQQQFFHAQPQAHFIHQYHPMMAAQGILIEIIDNEQANNLTGNGVSSAMGDTGTNGTYTNAQEQLYMITMNGQRYVMSEEQLRQYIAQIQQQQQQPTYQPSQDNIHTS